MGAATDRRKSLRTVAASAVIQMSFLDAWVRAPLDQPEILHQLDQLLARTNSSSAADGRARRAHLRARRADGGSDLTPPEKRGQVKLTLAPKRGNCRLSVIAGLRSRASSMARASKRSVESRGRL
jgi:hypothetical protein